MLLPDGSPSRDRLARIAAMIHEAEHAVGAGSEGAGDDGRLIPFVPRARRTLAARRRAGRVGAVGPAA